MGILKEKIFGINLHKEKTDIGITPSFAYPYYMYGIILCDDVLSEQIDIIENSKLIESFEVLRSDFKEEDSFSWQVIQKADHSKPWIEKDMYGYALHKDEVNTFDMVKEILYDDLRKILPNSFYADIRVDAFFSGISNLDNIKIVKGVSDLDYYGLFDRDVEDNFGNIDYNSRRKSILENCLKNSSTGAIDLCVGVRKYDFD